ncbi:MAG: tetratricopeptide repeat protein, partial [Acidobacteriota bacterium]
DLAKQEIATMNKLKAATKIPYWSKTIDVEIMSAEAWMFYLQGKKQKALKKMQAAADLESTYGKHPITPSELLPASELLGEMLLEMKKPAEALKAFEQALQRSPNRFHSLAGAARAAASADVAKAKKYYQALLELGAKAEGERPELAEAKKFLAGK